ncbi:MAG: ABC transporter ATP-binding protein [Alphaproteobacteria bacterium]|nr:ABC transporter ATP-binding protein [Alphaproteobacteria bacterium]
MVKPTQEPVVMLTAVDLDFLSPSGESLPTLRGIDMTISPGEFVALVGPTGCGKSTTLGLISGLLRPTRGRVELFGREVTGIDSRLGSVFQADALFPWRTVIGNVMAGPSFRGIDKGEASELARQWLARVGLAGFESYYPHQLSGGMRKRVALAQTFINQPQILLMDEPFSALDIHTRNHMYQEMLKLWSETNAAIIFVTHDLDEAVSLADTVFVMSRRPAHIIRRHPIDLARPRHLDDLRYQQRFIEQARAIWQDLKNEIVDETQTESIPS